MQSALFLPLFFETPATASFKRIDRRTTSAEVLLTLKLALQPAAAWSAQEDDIMLKEDSITVLRVPSRGKQTQVEEAGRLDEKARQQLSQERAQAISKTCLCRLSPRVEKAVYRVLSIL